MQGRRIIIKRHSEKGILADLHIHSEHSHDSKTPISEIKSVARNSNINIICITDHCDIQYCDRIDVEKLITDSIADAKRHNKNDDIQVLSGVEIGEALWNTQQAKRIVALEGLDQVIGAVHAVRFEGYTQPYSRIDFSTFTQPQLKAYLDTYFDDVLETVTATKFDILAHLTCPLRYINGNYARGIDCHMFQDKIKVILSEVIKREIVLEVNTSNCGSNYDEFMPEEWILKMYSEMGGQLLSCGSDAHISQHVAHHFDRFYKTLKKYNFHYLCYFKDRQLHKYLINEI